MADATLGYLIAIAIGLVVGVAEVLSRYRDAPFNALATMAGATYVLFNGATAGLALLFLLEVLPLWQDDPPAPTLASTLSNALMAGFGAMAVLRSSILTTRVGNKDVEVGPAAFVEIFRRVMDRNIARVRALKRAEEVATLMGDISFVRSYSSLSSICLSLLQSVDADERAAVEQQIGSLANQTGRSDRDKALELGLILASSAGFPALEASIRAIGDRISNTKERPAFVAEQVAQLTLEQVIRDLPAVCLAANPDVRSEEQRQLAEQVDAIDQSGLSEQAKKINVGLVIASALGEESLAVGVGLLAAPRPGP